MIFFKFGKIFWITIRDGGTLKCNKNFTQIPLEALKFSDSLSNTRDENICRLFFMLLCYVQLCFFFLSSSLEKCSPINFHLIRDSRTPALRDIRECLVLLAGVYLPCVFLRYLSALGNESGKVPLVISVTMFLPNSTYSSS